MIYQCLKHELARFVKFKGVSPMTGNYVAPNKHELCKPFSM